MATNPTHTDLALAAIERHAQRRDLSVSLWCATLDVLERRLILAREVDARSAAWDLLDEEAWS